MSAALFLVILVITFASVLSKKQTRNNNNITQQDKIWRSKKSDCQSSTCSHLAFHEGYNCVNECLSPKCYQSVYSARPLEDGEIDPIRDRDYIRCVRLEQKERNLVAAQATKK